MIVRMSLPEIIYPFTCSSQSMLLRMPTSREESGLFSSGPPISGATYKSCKPITFCGTYSQVYRIRLQPRCSCLVWWMGCTLRLKWSEGEYDCFDGTMAVGTVTFLMYFLHSYPAFPPLIARKCIWVFSSLLYFHNDPVRKPRLRKCNRSQFTQWVSWLSGNLNPGLLSPSLVLKAFYHTDWCCLLPPEKMKIILTNFWFNC